MFIYPSLIVLLCLLGTCAVVLVSGHGYIKNPIARTAIQLHRPPFPSIHEPFQWDHSGMMCNGAQQDLHYSRCGRCGEAEGQTEASQGGVYDKGVIVQTYEAGSVVEMVIEFLAGHYGHFQLELCPHPTETDSCFQTLPILNATSIANGGSPTSAPVRDQTKVCVPFNNRPCGSLCPGDDIMTAPVQLPPDVRCGRCTIRWTYRTSYPGGSDWDSCHNPAPAQTFRNCAYVQIV